MVNKFLWLDMEMTGLDVSKERIIEVAAIVTDNEFHPLEEYESVVYQPPIFIENMDQWNTEHHTRSGLVAKIPDAPRQDDVEGQLCELVRRHFPKEPAILCGNSIGQDRKFIDLYMPKFSQLLHYRMLDVTSWKIIMENKYGMKVEKKDSHRALDDIQESIGELKEYLKHIHVE
jgi:oligoribonuclease